MEQSLLAIWNEEYVIRHVPNTLIESRTISGTLQVVDSTRPWEGGYAALSSFGFGGSNVHLLMKGYPSPRAGAPPLISLTAEDASLAANGAAIPAPPVAFALTDALPLAARTAEGMEKLVAAIKVGF